MSFQGVRVCVEIDPMMSQYKHIIVPVDGSQGAGRAARFANDLGIATGTPVIHLHVFSVTAGEVVGMARLDQTDIETARKESASRAFSAAREAVGSSAHTFEERIVFGEAAEEILTFAEDHGPAMIVMGRRGLNTVQKLLLGSVSDSVIRNAKGPVTIVS